MPVCSTRCKLLPKLSCKVVGQCCCPQLRKGPERCPLCCLMLLCSTSSLICFWSLLWQDIEAKKEAQKEKEIDEQEANASTMHRCRTVLDKDFINTGIYENIASQTIARLKDVARRISNYLEAEHVSKERSASLDLLLRFQRLLVSKLYLGVTDTENVNGYRVLLPELVVSIILLLTIDAGLMQETGAIPLLAGLLEHLDRFNHLAPGHERDDNEDLAWPGIMVIDGKVYDIKDFQAQSQSLTGNSILAQFAGEDPVVALEAALQFEDTRESMQAFCVGQYMEVLTTSAVCLRHSLTLKGIWGC
ncbi:hypothetical protein XENOCAPTIV_024722, partial [Xenoophorus captivus]